LRQRAVSNRETRAKCRLQKRPQGCHRTFRSHRWGALSKVEWMQVPLLDLRQQYEPLKAQILAEIEKVADSQYLILGPQVEALERAVEQYTGAAHAIGVSSGTDAQLVLLMAMG